MNALPVLLNREWGIAKASCPRSCPTEPMLPVTDSGWNFNLSQGLRLFKVLLTLTVSF
jgi:hypothetical protein